MERIAFFRLASFFFASFRNLAHESKHKFVSDVLEFAIIRMAFAVPASSAFLSFRICSTNSHQEASISICRALSEFAMERAAKVEALCKLAAFFFSSRTSVAQESKHTFMSEALEFAIMRMAFAVDACAAFLSFRIFS